MSVIKACAFVLVISIFFIITKAQVGLDENCLGCICEGSSNCNVTLPCTSPFAGGYFCGPFRISYAYWTDAGKPVLGNDDPERKGAFENCVIDLQCAAQTVHGYMAKFVQDCDGDGSVSCTDYMRIHKLGGYGCNGAIEHTDYYRFYQECAAALNVF